MSWKVRASAAFWATVRPFKMAYPEREYLAIIKTIREAITELEQYGCVRETGWSEHRLAESPFDDETISSSTYTMTMCLLSTSKGRQTEPSGWLEFIRIRLSRRTDNSFFMLAKDGQNLWPAQIITIHTQARRTTEHAACAVVLLFAIQR